MFGANMDHRLFLSLQEGCCDETQICGLRSGIVAILASFLYKNPFYVIIARFDNMALYVRPRNFYLSFNLIPGLFTCINYFASWCDQILDTKQPK